jgi:hypothetical protein
MNRYPMHVTLELEIEFETTSSKKAKRLANAFIDGMAKWILKTIADHIVLSAEARPRYRLQGGLGNDHSQEFDSATGCRSHLLCQALRLPERL